MPGKRARPFLQFRQIFLHFRCGVYPGGDNDKINRQQERISRPFGETIIYLIAGLSISALMAVCLFLAQRILRGKCECMETARIQMELHRHGLEAVRGTSDERTARHILESSTEISAPAKRKLPLLPSSRPMKSRPYNTPTKNGGKTLIFPPFFSVKIFYGPC